MRVGLFLRKITIRVVAHAAGRVLASAFDDGLFNAPVAFFFLWCEVAIGLSLFKQSQRGGAMFISVRGLKYDGFVRFETDPGEPIKDRAGRFISRAGEVGVLDPQQKFAALLSGEK